MRPTRRTAFCSGHELPTPVGEVSVISTADKIRPVLERDPVGRLDYAPMRENARLHVAAIVSNAPSPIDFVPNPQFRYGSRATLSHLDGRVPAPFITTNLAPPPLLIDQPPKSHVGG